MSEKQEVNVLVKEKSLADLVSGNESLQEAVNKIEDTEAGLDVPSIPDSVKFGEGEAAFQKAIDEAAEQRARSPFEVACMQHSRLYGPFIEGLDKVSGGAAKRILRYLVGYPFFVDKLNPQDSNVESLAYIADKLGQTKHTILLIQAMEQEHKAQQTLAEHARIQELDLEGKKEE
jgi:hypothetical protein